MAAAGTLLPKLLVSRVPPSCLELCSQLTATDDPEFRPGSLVPAAQWTPAGAANDLDETPWLAFGKAGTLRHNVALLRLPSEPWKGHLLTNSHWHQSGEFCRELRARVDDVCRALSSAPDDLLHKGTFKGVRGETTTCTTRHPSDGRLVGLHVDNLQREPIATIDRTISRFCLNLGPNRRWFAFLPLDVASVVSACRLSEHDILTSRHFQQALRGRLHPPICRIPVEPGDAYIAPTQILLHDGHSDSQDGEYMYTVVGLFDQTSEAASLSAVLVAAVRRWTLRACSNSRNLRVTNRHRRHSALGMMSPVDYEQALQAGKAA
jgi:hypothetical protein